MAEAKVDITVAVEDAGLKRLNSSLASGQQNAKALKTELKNLERETQNGTKATEEQRAALQDLQQQLNIQTEANKRYSKAIKEAYNSALKQAEGADGSSTSLKALAGRMLEGVNASSVMNTAIGMLTSNLHRWRLILLVMSLPPSLTSWRPSSKQVRRRSLPWHSLRR